MNNTNKNNKYQDYKREFDSLVTEAKSIIIMSHTNPDDDSISSSLAVYYYLTEVLNLTKPIRIVYTGDSKYDKRYSYFKNYNLIQFVENSPDNIKPADLVIVLDTNDFLRVTDKNESRNVSDFDNKFIIIDHHKTHTDCENFELCIKDLMSSTAEVIYKLLWRNYKENINKDIAEILLLGIIGDTGQFKYVANTHMYKDTLQVTDELIKYGDIYLEELISKYDKTDIAELQVFSILARNLKIENIKGLPPFAYTYVENEELKGFVNTQILGGINSFKNVIKSIYGADWGFMVRPKPAGGYAVSFRAIPNSINVREIAEHFGGGGHDLASGADLPENVDSAKSGVRLILEYLKTIAKK